jgi:hypothetical protein
MSVIVDASGNLRITVEKQENFSIVDELELRRTALYDAIEQQNTKEFVGSDLNLGLVSILKDLDPTTDQWNEILQPKK